MNGKAPNGGEKPAYFQLYVAFLDKDGNLVCAAGEDVMDDLSTLSHVLFWIPAGLIGAYVVLLCVWQSLILGGKKIRNPDGSLSVIEEDPNEFGFALADVFVIGPATIAAFVLVFTAPPWGCLVLAMIAFWFFWVNVATTAVSLKFHKPKITLVWYVLHVSRIGVES